MMRSIGVAVASMLIAYLVTALGAFFIPEAVPPTEAALAAAASEPSDAAALAELLEKAARPGELLIFVVFPLASIALGTTAALLSRNRQGLPIAGVASASLWIAFILVGSYVWSNPPDPPGQDEVQAGVAYVAIATFSGWAAATLRAKLSQG
jgi:hypothetical protein